MLPRLTLLPLQPKSSAGGPPWVCSAREVDDATHSLAAALASRLAAAHMPCIRRAFWKAPSSSALSRSWLAHEQAQFTGLAGLACWILGTRVFRTSPA